MSAIRTTIDAIAAFHEGFPDKPYDGKDKRLSDPERETLKRIEGIADPQPMAVNLSSLIKAVWVAQTSGELQQVDLENALWTLHELADLIAHAALVSSNAAWRLQQDELNELKRRLKEAEEKAQRRAA